jgi:hypothetical protein
MNKKLTETEFNEIGKTLNSIIYTLKALVKIANQEQLKDAYQSINEEIKKQIDTEKKSKNETTKK